MAESELNLFVRICNQLIVNRTDCKSALALFTTSTFNCHFFGRLLRLRSLVHSIVSKIVFLKKKFSGYEID